MHEVRSQGCRQAYVQTCSDIHSSALMRKCELTGTSKKLGDLGGSKGGTDCDGYEGQVRMLRPRKRAKTVNIKADLLK